MTAAAGFEPVTEVTADDRARIAFGRLGVHKDDRFLVARGAGGEILLTPVTSIPTRELVVWENDELRASLLKGLAEASEGLATPRPGYLDIDDDDE